MTDTPQPSPKKKTGRPALPADEKLSELFKLRLSVRTRDKLATQSQRAGLSESEWLRRRIDGSRIRSVSTQADPHLVTALNNMVLQLRRIGVNANQMALDVNRGSDFHVYWQDVADQLEKDMGEARALLNRLLESTDK